MNEKKSKKILIVDDSSTNIQIIGIMLQGNNFELFFAQSGKTAFEIINNNDIDLILLDVMMPEMDGFDICRKLKSDEKTNFIPIIFITARIEEESVIRGFDVGAEDYVTKPFNEKELIARVKTHLQIKEQKESLKTMNELLEKKVYERTKSLEIANEKLSRLDQIKSDFLGLISHELRTPLNGIIGFSDLLSEMLTEPEQLAFMKEIVKSSNLLLKLSNAALLIIELKANSYKMNIERLSVKELVTGTIEGLKQKQESGNIKIVTDFNPEELFIKADKLLIMKVLTNILDNSIKFSKDNQAITITGKTENENVIIEIIDNGTGFSPDSLGNLFELFSIEDFDHHRDGLGLSLYIAKLIINYHNGQIEAFNRKEGGAVIRITLSLQ
jgi:two-component system, sensor histidine kinase and response regulator